MGAHFSDLRGLLFKLRCEALYLFLLLHDRCLQRLNFEIELGLLDVGHGGLGGFGGKSARVGSSDGERTQSSIGIDEHKSRRPCGNRRTDDVVDKTPITYLAKNTVDTREVADDDIVIGGGDTIPGLSAYAHVVAGGLTAIERYITDGCVVGSAGVASEGINTQGHVVESIEVVDERMETSGRVGAASVVLERTITDGRVAGPATVAKPGERANRRIGTASGVAQKRSGANSRIFTASVQYQRCTADGRAEITVGEA